MGKLIKLIFSDTVGDIACLIESKEGIPTDQQRLIFKGSQLCFDKLAVDYGISDHSTLHLCLRLRGQ